MKKLIIIFLIFPCISFSQEKKSFAVKDGTKLYYTTFGSGTKVVILYGGPGYGCNTIFNWADILKSNQCIFFDQRGTGLSKNVKQDTSTINLRTAVSDLEFLRKHLNEEKLTIIGFSWGAALAMAYVAKYPEQVANLILVSPTGPDLSFRNEMYYNILSRRSQEETDSLNYWMQKDNIVKDEILAYKMQTYYSYIPYFYNHESGGKMLWGLINNADYNPLMFNLMWEDLNRINYDIKAGLKKYRGKCTIIRGQQDVIGYKVIVQISQCLPQTVVSEIHACGHFVDLECPYAFRFNIKTALK